MLLAVPPNQKGYGMGFRAAASFFSFSALPAPWDRAGTGVLAGGSLGRGSGIGTELMSIYGKGTKGCRKW